MSLLVTCEAVTLSKEFSPGFKKVYLKNYSNDFTSVGDNIVTIFIRDNETRKTFSAMLTGVVQPESGNFKILLDGTEARNGALIPEAGLSVPWMSVEDSMKQIVRSKNNGISDESIIRIIKAVGLEGYEKHVPHSVSFGFHLRTAFALCIVSGCQFVVVDNFLSKIESRYLPETIEMLQKVQKEFQVGIIILNLEDSILKDHFSKVYSIK